MIVAADEVLFRGLVLVGFSAIRQGKVSRSTNLGRFRSHYGSNPSVYAKIWEDLQTLPIPEAHIDSREGQFINLDNFLLAMHFLKCYPTETQLAASFKVCEKTAGKCSWFFAQRVRALKTAKVSHEAQLCR